MSLPLTVASGLLLAFWLFIMFRGLRDSRRLLNLKPNSPTSALSSKPLVSVLVPARNEEEIVEECVRSILAQDYGNFEIVVVDDDSSDRTGEILDGLSKDFPGKLRVIHVKGDLPPGWVGKHYALTLAESHARGEWLVMTDADMIYEKETLSRALETALPGQIELFSLFPKPVSIGFWERVVMPVFGLLIGISMPVGDVNNPKRKAALAAGGFILIRRKVFREVGGYGPAADHLVDDVLLAKRVKDRGFRIQVAEGDKLLSTRMYRGLADLWEGVEKSAGPAVDFRPQMLVFSVLFLLAVAALPVAGVWSCVLWAKEGIPETWKLFSIFGAVNAFLLLAGHTAVCLRFGIPPIPYVLFAPLGYLFYAAAQISSFFKGRFGRGVEWKGRRYYGVGKPLPKTKIGI